MPPRNLSILPFVVNRLVSIHFGSGDTVMGTVQRIDDPVIIVSLSIVCEDGDEYDSGMFPFGGLRKPRASIFLLRNAWLLEIHTAQAQRRYLQDKTIAEQYTRKWQYLTDGQRKAFSDFQLCERSGRLHRSTVYGMSTPNSDVDICIDEDRLDDLAGKCDVRSRVMPFKNKNKMIYYT